MSKLGKFSAACAAAVCGFGAFGALTSQSYRGSGLIAQWDAIDNAVDAGGNRYHDPAATVWKDLSGNGMDLEIKNGTWPEDGRSFRLSSGNARRAGSAKNLKTAEVCLHTPAKTGWYGGGADDQYGLAFSSDPRQYVYFQTDKFIMAYDHYGYSSETSVLNRDAVLQFVWGNGSEVMSYMNGVASPGEFNDYWPVGDEICIGNRNGGNGRGTFHSLRLYSTFLSEEDLAWNQAVDDIRFFDGASLNVGLGDLRLVSASDSVLNFQADAVKWHVASDNESRELFVDYREKGSENWSSQACEGPFEVAGQPVQVVIRGLTQETEYEVRLRADCTYCGEFEKESVGPTNTFTTAAADPNPSIDIIPESAAIGRTGMEIPAVFNGFGTGAERIESAMLSVGFSEGSYDYVEELPTAFFTVGRLPLPIQHFRFGEVTYVKLTAVNDIGGRLEKVFSFVAPAETYGARLRRGVWQTKFAPKKNCTVCGGALAELTSDPNAFDIMKPSEGDGEFDRQLVEGAIIADPPKQNDASATSEMTGRTYVLGSPVVFGYQGYMWMEAGKVYAFGGDMNDSSRCYVDDVQVMYQPNYGSFSYGVCTAQTTGWHPIRVYIGHTSGQGGRPVNGVGFAWNDKGITSLNPTNNWRRLVDTDGTLLAAGLEQNATESVIQVERMARVGNRLVAKIKMASGGMSGSTFFVYAGAYFGGMELTPEMQVTELVSVDDQTAICDITVPEEVNYVRFGASSESFGGPAVSWAKSIYWPDVVQSDSVPPMLISATHDAHNAADDVVVVGRYFSLDAGASVSVTLDGTAKTATLDGNGNFSAGFSELDETVEHEYSVTLTDASGSDSLPPVSFTFSRDSVFGTTSETKTMTDAQTTILISAEVKSLGVGETWAVFYAGTDKNDLREVNRVKVQFQGVVSATLEGYSWSDTIYAKVGFETTCRGETSSSLTSQSSCTIVDNSVYTWKDSVTEGVWSDPNNWFSDHTCCIGYPSNTYSSIIFPSTPVRIKIDGIYPVNEMRWGQAQLTLWSEDPASCGITARDNQHPNGSNRRLTFDHVSYVSTYRLHMSGGSVLCVTNGASVSYANNPIQPQGAKILVTDGSSLTVKNFGDISNAEIEIDDSVLRVLENAALNGSTVRFAGNSPRLEVAGADRGIVSSAGADPSRIVFDIPAGGYAAVPIVGTNKTCELFANGNPEWMTLAATGDAGVRAVQHQPLIVWDGGIATSNCTAEAVAIKDCGFEYSERAVPSYRPWRMSPEGLSVKTVGFHGAKAGLAIIVR